MELGVNPELHPLHDLWSSIDLLISQLLTSLWAIRSLKAPLQSPEQIKRLHHKEAELIDILIIQILRISGELRSPKTINDQKLNPQAMQEIKKLTQNFSQWLEQTTEETLATENQQINEQRLRQIILRVTLIDYIRSAIVETTSSRTKSAITNNP
jgi:MinD-like ATPase involved in chromosome partitioning or flagellar assembly